MISFAQNGSAIPGYQSSLCGTLPLVSTGYMGKKSKKTAYPRLSDTDQAR
jgi:hypothetical protein